MVAVLFQAAESGGGIDTSDLVSGLIGAVIGGVLAVAGAVWANRREVIRDARTRIYQEMLPPLLDRSGYRSAGSLKERVITLRRIGPRTTRGDRRRIEALWRFLPGLMNAAVAAVREQTPNPQTGRQEASEGLEREFTEAGDRFHEQARAFEEHLERRIL